MPSKVLRVYDADGRIQFDADRAAARQYFLQHVLLVVALVHQVRQLLLQVVEEHRVLVDVGYYEKHVLDQYDFADIKELYKQAYARKLKHHLNRPQEQTVQTIRLPAVEASF